MAAVLDCVAIIVYTKYCGTVRGEEACENTCIMGTSHYHYFAPMRPRGFVGAKPGSVIDENGEMARFPSFLQSRTSVDNPYVTCWTSRAHEMHNILSNSHAFYRHFAVGEAQGASRRSTNEISRCIKLSQPHPFITTFHYR
jgi:hypothetical protein